MSEVLKLIEGLTPIEINCDTESEKSVTFTFEDNDRTLTLVLGHVVQDNETVNLDYVHGDLMTMLGTPITSVKVLNYDISDRFNFFDDYVGEEMTITYEIENELQTLTLCFQGKGDGISTMSVDVYVTDDEAKLNKRLSAWTEVTEFDYESLKDYPIEERFDALVMISSMPWE